MNIRDKHGLILVVGISILATLAFAAGVRSWTLSSGQSVGDLLSRAEAAIPVPSEGDTIRMVTEVFEEQPEDPLRDPYHQDPLSLTPEYSIVSKTQLLGPSGTVALSDVRQYLKDRSQSLEARSTHQPIQFFQTWLTRHQVVRGS
jgi:hypothetical protein